MSALEPVRLVHTLEQALAVLAALSDEPQNVRELAEASKVPRSTAHRHAYAFVALGRAERVQGGWIAVPLPETSPPSRTREPAPPTPISSKRSKRRKGTPDPFVPNGRERCERCNQSLPTFGGRALSCPCAQEAAA